MHYLNTQTIFKVSVSKEKYKSWRPVYYILIVDPNGITKKSGIGISNFTESTDGYFELPYTPNVAGLYKVSLFADTNDFIEGTNDNTAELGSFYFNVISHDSTVDINI